MGTAASVAYLASRTRSCLRIFPPLFTPGVQFDSRPSGSIHPPASAAVHRVSGSLLRRERQQHIALYGAASITGVHKYHSSHHHRARATEGSAIRRDAVHRLILTDRIEVPNDAAFF